VRETQAEIALNQDTPPAKPKRIVTAPASAALNGSLPVLSVELEMDEEVNWQWMHLPNNGYFPTRVTFVS